MSQMLDPTFYRTPADAIAAPPERLAYVAAYDPAGQARDAMTVIDCDPSSSDYGKVVGWSVKALFTAHVLARLEDDLGVSIRDSFDLIAGTSAGGIIALALGAACGPPTSSSTTSS
jgi:56kDa selenium binding protein (SBP56)/Patatin-like phospholipase